MNEYTVVRREDRESEGAVNRARVLKVFLFYSLSLPNGNFRNDRNGVY